MTGAVAKANLGTHAHNKEERKDANNDATTHGWFFFLFAVGTITTICDRIDWEYAEFI